MRLLLLVPSYIRWHYTTALISIERIFGNFLWFLWNFFSVGLLTRTFFSPWERLQETRTSQFDIGNALSTAVINIIMRLVGVLIRSVCIAIGLIACACTVVAAFVTFVIWICAPFIILGALISGLTLIFHPVL